MLARIGDIRFPWRAGRAQPVGLDPPFERRVALWKLIVRAGMNRNGRWAGWECAGDDFALT